MNGLIVEITAYELKKLKDTLGKKYTQIKRLHEENVVLQQRCAKMAKENKQLRKRLEELGDSAGAIATAKHIPMPTQRRRWKPSQEDAA